MTILTLMMSLLMGNSDAVAQLQPQPQNQPNRAATVLPIPQIGGQTAPSFYNRSWIQNKAAPWLIRRIEQISVEGLAAKMEQDGIQKRDFIAVFTVEGALLYQSDLSNDRTLSWTDIGRNSGFQVLPFQLKLADDGRRYLSASLFRFKNMTAVQESDQYYSSADYSSNPAQFFQAIDQFNIGVVTWDRGYTLHHVNSFQLSFFQLRSSIEAVNNHRSKEGFFINLGVEMGIKNFTAEQNGKTYFFTKPNTYLNDYEQNNFSKNRAPYFLQVLTGIHYHNQFSKKYTLDAKLNANISMQQGSTISVNSIDSALKTRATHLAALDAYQQALNNHNSALQDYSNANQIFNAAKMQFDYDKLGYEIANGYTAPLTNEEYTTLTGVAAPTAPTKPTAPTEVKQNDELLNSNVTTIANRFWFNLIPEIELSKRVSKKGASLPVYMGLTMNARIPVVDRFRFLDSSAPVDFRNQNREWIRVGLKLRF